MLTEPIWSSLILVFHVDDVEKGGISSKDGKFSSLLTWSWITHMSWTEKLGCTESYWKHIILTKSQSFDFNLICLVFKQVLRVKTREDFWGFFVTWWMVLETALWFMLSHMLYSCPISFLSSENFPVAKYLTAINLWTIRGLCSAEIL